MILQLYVFALFFLVFGIISIVREKKLLGGMFILPAIFLSIVGTVVIVLYPQTFPF